MYISFFK